MRLATVVSYLSLLACAHARVLDVRAASAHVPTGIASSAASLHTLANEHATSDASYWLADIKHQGVAAFNANPSGYTVFRNVKDYGAKGIVDLVLSMTRQMANALCRRRRD